MKPMAFLALLAYLYLGGIPCSVQGATYSDASSHEPVDSVLRMAYLDVHADDAVDAPMIELEGESDVPTDFSESMQVDDDVVEIEGTSIDTDTEETQVIQLDTTRTLDPGIEVLTEEEAEDLISITLDDVPLQDVVRMFTRISGANIVAGTNLAGNVTVSLQDVEWEPALQVILDSVDLALVEKSGNIYTIMSKLEVASEPVTTETLFLSFTTVTTIVPVVQQMLVSTNASVAGFPAANAVIVQETSARIQKIKETIAIIDKPRPQVFIEAKFVELNDQAIKDLGIDWQVLRSYTVRAGSLGVTYTDDRTRGLTTRSSSTDTRTDSDSQIRRGQTLEGSGSASFGNSGSSFPPLAFDTESGTGSGSVFGENIGGIDPETGQVDPILTRENVRTRINELEDISEISEVWEKNTARMLGATLTAQEFALTLSALKSNEGTSIISNPKVIVASGETASIHVGRNEPNVVAVPQGDSGDRFAYQLSGDLPYLQIGVKLDVTPTVNTEENISLIIRPELSRVIGDKVVGEANTSFPITQTRKIDTQFNLESGHTVAIGGLTETTDNERVIKVPFFGDIPIIGKYFFTHTHMEKLQDEVIIFVTVGLANPHELAEASGIPQGGRLIHRHMAQQALEAQEAIE